MKNRKNHIGSHRQNMVVSYPVSLAQRLYSIFWGPLLVLLVLFFALKILSNAPQSASALSFSGLLLALTLTLARLAAAYALALVFSVPLALLATANYFTEKIFLPLFDIMESIPVLAFFPVLILLFIKMNFLNGAAIFILFLSMLWNIVFTAIGGLKTLPNDIKAAARVFGVRGFGYFRKIILPAIFPQLVTGSILALAQGWNIIIVAEVLHTYIQGGPASQDLFGIGSVLVSAAASGQNRLFIAAIVVMTLAIAALNFLVWQKLLHYAERFKFE